MEYAGGNGCLLSKNNVWDCQTLQSILVLRGKYCSKQDDSIDYVLLEGINKFKD